jgi:hypothetical protein
VKFGQAAAATPAPAAEPAKVSILLNHFYLFSKKLLFVMICVHKSVFCTFFLTMVISGVCIGPVTGEIFDNFCTYF